MPAPIRPVDEHGFPIPSKFEALPGSLDEPRRPKRSMFQRMGRWRWLLLLLVPPLLFGRQLVDLGRGLVASVQLDRAQRDVDAGRMRQALVHADRAIAWEPDGGRRAVVLLLRSQVHEELHRLSDGMQDCNEAIALLNQAKPLGKRSEDLAKLYGQRAELNRRLAHPREALADCKAALESCPSGVLLDDPEAYARLFFERANLLNERAYISALSGIDVETGWQDIQQAIREFGEEPEFLDTRACVRYRLGQYNEALPDVDNAIHGVIQRKFNFESIFASGGVHVPPEEERAVGRRIKKRYDEELGILYHHRGEIYQKLGKDRPDAQSKAEADFQRATELKFDSTRGESLDGTPAKEPASREAVTAIR